MLHKGKFLPHTMTAPSSSKRNCCGMKSPPPPPFYVVEWDPPPQSIGRSAPQLLHPTIDRFPPHSIEMEQRNGGQTANAVICCSST